MPNFSYDVQNFTLSGDRVSEVRDLPNFSYLLIKLAASSPPQNQLNVESVMGYDAQDNPIANSEIDVVPLNLPQNVTLGNKWDKPLPDGKVPLLRISGLMIDEVSKKLNKKIKFMLFDAKKYSDPQIQQDFVAYKVKTTHK